MSAVRKKRVTARTVKPKNAEDRLIQIAALRKRAAAIKAKIDEQQAVLLEEMEALELTTLTVHSEIDDVDITGTRVQASSVVIDETKLQKKVGASIWNKITRKQLDKKLLESAVQSGAVKETDLADASTVTPNKPFVKVTVK